MAQQYIARQFHMPVVLRQLFVALEQEVPLRPSLHLGLTHSLEEGGGLVAAHVFEVLLDLLLQLTHRLADLRYGPLRTKFCVAVALHLASSQDGSNPVACQPDTVR